MKECGREMTGFCTRTVATGMSNRKNMTSFRSQGNYEVEKKIPTFPTGKMVVPIDSIYKRMSWFQRKHSVPFQAK